MNPLLLSEEVIGGWPQWHHENWNAYGTRHCSNKLSATPLKKQGWQWDDLFLRCSFPSNIYCFANFPFCSILYHAVFTIHKLSILHILLLSFWFNDSPCVFFGVENSFTWYDECETWGHLQELGSNSINIPLKKGASEARFFFFFPDKVVSQSAFSGFPLNEERN